MLEPEWREYSVRGIDDTEVYIDNIGILSNFWDSHIAKLDRILDKLEEHKFIIAKPLGRGVERQFFGT